MSASLSTVHCTAGAAARPASTARRPGGISLREGWTRGHVAHICFVCLTFCWDCCTLCRVHVSTRCWGWHLLAARGRPGQVRPAGGDRPGHVRAGPQVRQQHYQHCPNHFITTVASCWISQGSGDQLRYAHRCQDHRELRGEHRGHCAGVQNTLRAQPAP